MREEEQLKNEIKQEKAKLQQNQVLRRMYMAENEALNTRRSSLKLEEVEMVKADLLSKCKSCAQQDTRFSWCASFYSHTSKFI